MFLYVQSIIELLMTYSITSSSLILHMLIHAHLLSKYVLVFHHSIAYPWSISTSPIVPYIYHGSIAPCLFNWASAGSRFDPPSFVGLVLGLYHYYYVIDPPNAYLYAVMPSAYWFYRYVSCSSNNSHSNSNSWFAYACACCFVIHSCMS